MTNKEFNNVVRHRINLIKNTLYNKGIEYTSNNEDRLINFTIAANFQGITRKQALMGMLAKHLSSLEQMVRMDKKLSYANNVWEEKLGDAINYLILLEAMVYEENETDVK